MEFVVCFLVTAWVVCRADRQPAAHFGRQALSIHSCTLPAWRASLTSLACSPCGPTGCRDYTSGLGEVLGFALVMAGAGTRLATAASGRATISSVVCHHHLVSSKCKGNGSSTALGGGHGLAFCILRPFASQGTSGPPSRTRCTPPGRVGPATVGPQHPCPEKQTVLGIPAVCAHHRPSHSGMGHMVVCGAPSPGQGLSRYKSVSCAGFPEGIVRSQLRGTWAHFGQFSGGGGATAHFRKHQNLGSLQFLGRWADASSLQHYLQEAVASLMWLSLSPRAVSRVQHAALWFAQLSAPPRAISLVLDKKALRLRDLAVAR